MANKGGWFAVGFSAAAVIAAGAFITYETNAKEGPLCDGPVRERRNAGR